MTQRRLAKTSDETTLRNYPSVTAKDIFDEAKAGDEVALRLVDELGQILGSTLSNLACVVNPEVIVIGGGVSKAGSILIDTVQKHFAETAFHACRDTRFELASLGNDAGIYGCMRLMLD
jgi:glucokinase